MAVELPDPFGLRRAAAPFVEALLGLVLLPRQLERLLDVVENMNARVDLTIDGITRAADGIGRVNAALDQSLPELASAAGALRDLVGELQATIASLADQLPMTTQVLQEALPQLTGAIDAIEARIGHFDGVVDELGQTVVAVAGAIPGVRRAVRR